MNTVYEVLGNWLSHDGGVIALTLWGLCPAIVIIAVGVFSPYQEKWKVFLNYKKAFVVALLWLCLPFLLAWILSLS